MILLLFSFLIGSSGAIAQSKTVEGTVTSSGDNQPLAGVVVNVEGTIRNVVTDAAGHYTLSGINSTNSLVFSFVGYSEKKIRVGEQEIINVVLDPTVSSLDQVVVVGCGTAQKANLTAAVASISSEALSEELNPCKRWRGFTRRFTQLKY